MVDGGHRKDDDRGRVSGCSHECLPPERGEPPNGVGQEFTLRARGEFGDPIYVRTVSDIKPRPLVKDNSRYCPPLVGAMLAISAKEAASAKVQIHVAR